MKATGFKGQADILGATRTVEFDGDSLRIYTLSMPEAERLVTQLEYPLSALPPTIRADAPAPPRERIEHKPAPTPAAAPSTPAVTPAAAPPPEAAPVVATPVAGPGRARKRAPDATPPAAVANGAAHANGVSGAAAHAAPETPAAAAAVPAAVKKAEAKKAQQQAQAAGHRAANADVKALSAPACTPEVTKEIRAAFGINPALLSAAHREVLISLAIDDGYVPPALAGDGEAAWEVLVAEVPPGFFAAHSDTVKDALADAAAEREGIAEENTDPLGLTADGEGDPDEDPIQGSVEDTTGARYDLAVLSTAPTMRDVLSHLIDSGVKTTSGLVQLCVKLKAAVPVLSRVSDIEGRVPRTLSTLGLELPA